MSESQPLSGRHVAGSNTLLRVRSGATTHTGMVRDHNEDAYLAQAPVFLVADGMGGHRAGAQAAATALAEFAGFAGSESISQAELDAALARAAVAVHELGDGVAAPGSTLSGLVFSRQGALPCARVVNIGDSRTYCLRDQTLRQLTHDHSEVQEQVDAGLITREEARLSDIRNVITRALGAGVGPHVRADQTLVPLRSGDRFLVCSDGLSSLVPDAVIARTLHAVAEPQAAAEVLTGLALEAGGNDNVSVIVVDVLQAEPQWPEQSALEATLPTRARAVEDTIPRAELARNAQNLPERQDRA